MSGFHKTLMISIESLGSMTRSYYTAQTLLLSFYFNAFLFLDQQPSGNEPCPGRMEDIHQ